MYWVYAIKSQIDNRIYVGMTSNVDKRVAEYFDKLLTEWRKKELPEEIVKSI